MEAEQIKAKHARIYMEIGGRPVEQVKAGF
jgi:hypothetical protein